MTDCISYKTREGKPMKAVLEFNYPDDEDKLRHALSGGEYHAALLDILDVLKDTRSGKAEEVKTIINKVLGG